MCVNRVHKSSLGGEMLVDDLLPQRDLLASFCSERAQLVTQVYKPQNGLALHVLLRLLRLSYAYLVCHALLRLGLRLLLHQALSLLHHLHLLLLLLRGHLLLTLLLHVLLRSLLLLLALSAWLWGVLRLRLVLLVRIRHTRLRTHLRSLLLLTWMLIRGTGLATLIALLGISVLHRELMLLHLLALGLLLCLVLSLSLSLLPCLHLSGEVWRQWNSVYTHSLIVLLLLQVLKLLDLLRAHALHTALLLLLLLLLRLLLLHHRSPLKHMLLLLHSHLRVLCHCSSVSAYRYQHGFTDLYSLICCCCCCCCIICCCRAGFIWLSACAFCMPPAILCPPI